ANLDRIDRMVQDLLDVSRVHAGERLPLQIEAADASAIVAEAIRDLTAVHGERFVVEAPATVPGHWDPALLRRAIENVLGNAVKHGDPRAPIRLHLEEMGGRAIIEVHNEADPIPAHEQETLFAPSRRSL